MKALWLALAAVGLASLKLGPVPISWHDVADALLRQDGPSSAERVIVREIRLPRVLTGMLVGAALALAGALLQGIFRNPLAGPEIVGASTGSALGAVSALALGLGALSVWAVPAFAFAGSLAASFLVYALATRGGRTPIATLVLCGLAINSIAAALTALVLSLSVGNMEVARQIVAWMLGDLTDRSWEHVVVIAPFVCVCALGAGLFPRELNLMTLGEESAAALGVETRRVTRGALVLAAAAAGAATAVAGVVGFVGLMVPHMARLVMGPDHRRLLPACLVAGALMVSAMDLAARTLLPGQEVRLGILTSGLGGPFFLWLLLRCRERAEVL